MKRAANLEALRHSSNLQLFQLNSAIERMLADLRRIVQVHKDLHLGMTVCFMNGGECRMRVGQFIATLLTLHEAGRRSSWTLPYAAVEPPAPRAAKPEVTP